MAIAFPYIASYFYDDVMRNGTIDLLHWDITFVYVRILPYGGRYVCILSGRNVFIAVIERKMRSLPAQVTTPTRLVYTGLCACACILQNIQVLLE